MDNSQSSDFFTEVDHADLRGERFSTDAQTFYETLLTSAKEAFGGYKNEIQKPTFPTYLTTVLEDSWNCITCSLDDLIKGLLSDSTVQIEKVVGYLNDSVLLLQMLSTFYESIITSVSMSCSSMKTLPKQTGLIILSVFVHCRDSESLYRHHLVSVEKQLKDLFRNCHELQQIYLLILEKHFSIDLTEEEDKNILVEALKINLSIGQVVQSLDVRTMAVQWKAYSAICEKYSRYVGDTDVFIECTQILCTLIKDNIETSIEKNQDEKVIMRSLKVASFTIKVLLKICIIFKQSPNKNYRYILQLLEYVMINNTQYLETSTGAFASMMKSNVVVPSDGLLQELLLDEEFLHCLCSSVSSFKCDEDTLNDEHLLGLLLIITSAMKCAAKNRREEHNCKDKLVSCVYVLLPYSPICFERRLCTNKASRSIFEHTLAHTAALALTMTSKEFNALEKNMIEAILGTECVSALFSSILWLILADYISPQLLFNQLIWLCTMYKKLDAHKMYLRSPQNTHLSCTISTLFSVIGDEEKTKFCKQFRIHDEDNMPLWTALQIRNLPVESQQNAEDAIVEKLESIFGRLHDSDSAELLTQITKLAGTCSFNSTKGVDNHVARAWSKLCQQKQVIVLGLDNNTVWFYDYVTALVSLTHSVVAKLKGKGANFLEVLHVVSCLTKSGDAEMKLILTNLLCELATSELNEHRNLIDSHCTEAFTSLLHHPEIIVQSNLLRTLRSYSHNKYLSDLVSNIVRENSLQDTWQDLKLDADKFRSISKYTHKCFDICKGIVMNVHELKEAKLDDFYFDSGGSEIAESEINEPTSKRGKPNTHEADCIIRGLEEHVTLLVSDKVYTPEQLIRIKNVCVKLENITH